PVVSLAVARTWPLSPSTISKDFFEENALVCAFTTNLLWSSSMKIPPRMMMPRISSQVLAVMPWLPRIRVTLFLALDHSRKPADDSQPEQGEAAQQDGDGAVYQRRRPECRSRRSPFFQDQHLVEVDGGKAVADEILLFRAQRTHHIDDQTLNTLFLAKRFV